MGLSNEIYTPETQVAAARRGCETREVDARIRAAQARFVRVPRAVDQVSQRTREAQLSQVDF